MITTADFLQLILFYAAILVVAIGFIRYKTKKIKAFQRKVITTLLTSERYKKLDPKREKVIYQENVQKVFNKMTDIFLDKPLTFKDQFESDFVNNYLTN